MPQTLGPTVLITAFTLTSLSTVIVALRFFCRHFLVRAIKIYDYLMLLALLLTWGIATINYYQVKFGTGKHIKDQDKSLGPLGLEGTLKSWYTYQLAYLVDLCAVKLSILTFYRAISTQRAYRIAIYAVMGIVAAFTIVMVFVNAFECKKPSDAWSAEILLQRAGSCRDLHSIYYGQAAFNILSDLAILLLPMPVLWSLQMPKNKRNALIGIFSVGSLAVIASAVRVYALSLWSAKGADIPYEGANILVWSQIEINSAIISASIPSLKPLFSRTFSSTSPSYGASRQYQNYGRSYGHGNTHNSRRVNRITSFSDQQLESSVSIFTQGKDPSGAMELGGLRRGVGGNDFRDSDEEEMLSKGSPVYITQMPMAATRQERSNSIGNGTADAGLHIMRSVTIETSSRPK